MSPGVYSTCEVLAGGILKLLTIEPPEKCMIPVSDGDVFSIVQFIGRVSCFLNFCWLALSCLRMKSRCSGLSVGWW